MFLLNSVDCVLVAVRLSKIGDATQLLERPDIIVATSYVFGSQSANGVNLCAGASNSSFVMEPYQVYNAQGTCCDHGKTAAFVYD